MDFPLNLFKGLDIDVGVRTDLATVEKKSIIFYLETPIERRKLALK